jgi:hypothetical protein
MIRRLLQAIDPDPLSTVIGPPAYRRALTGTTTDRRAIAVDGKTLRESRTTDTTAQHVLAACDHDSGIGDSPFRGDCSRHATVGGVHGLPRSA